MSFQLIFSYENRFSYEKASILDSRLYAKASKKLYANSIKTASLEVMKTAKKDSIVLPFQQGEYPNYYTTWTHPKTEKRTTNSLKTTDYNEAFQIYIDLKRLMETPALWSLDSDHPDVDAYHDRAVELFYGKARRPRKIALEAAIGNKEVGAGRRHFLNSRRHGRKELTKLTVDLPDEDERRRQEAAKDRRILQLEREAEEDRNQIRELQRKLNQHCKETVEDAVSKFEKYYPEGHSPTDADQVIRIAKSFRDRFGGKKLIGQVASQHVNDWVNNLKREDKKSKAPLALPTKGKYKRYLSVFLTWAYKHYDLSENPMLKTLPVAGIARYPENIIAIRRFEQLEALIEALEGWPYWQAWVATAALAGPRWSEQAWLKKDDVYIDDLYLRVTSRAGGRRHKAGKSPLQGTKTGRERNVPLERKILLPILKAHLELLPDECKWAFPRLEWPTGKMTTGRWCASNWHKQWKTIWPAAKEKSNVAGDFWNYGPDEWRHCAATAMGHSGCNEVQVAQWSGNSPIVVRRHYMAPVSAKGWPLKWG